jgi:hypothetical protein
MSGSRKITRKTLALLTARSKGICEDCKRAPASTAHAILPTSLGGSHEISNVKHLCRPCHEKYHPFMRYPPGRRAGVPFFKTPLGNYYRGNRHDKPKAKYLEAHPQRTAKDCFIAFLEKTGL